jgi:iron complex transport system substrate-binding protein
MRGYHNLPNPSCRLTTTVPESVDVGMPTARRAQLTIGTVRTYQTRFLSARSIIWLTLFALLCAYRAEAQPRRIVSTSPSITETLFALGLGQQVVGVSNYCEYPPSVLSLPKVGTYLHPDAELIARLQPDLVIVHRLPNEITNRLTALHIPFAEVDRGGVQDTYSEILQIGHATQTDSEARNLVNRLQKRMEEIHHQSQGQHSPTVVFVIGRTPGTLSNLVVVGRDAFLNELIETAGGANLMATQSGPGYSHISLETILRLNPDVIIDMGDMGATEEERRKKVESNQALWGQVSDLQAVRNRRVYCISSTAFVVPGPRVVDAAKTLFEILHGHEPQ